MPEILTQALIFDDFSENLMLQFNGFSEEFL